jgi:hypothetical protein
MPDYLLLNDADFDGFFSFMNEYVGQKCGGNRPEWDHIPPEPRNALIDAYAVWEEAFKRMNGPHTLVDTSTKNKAKKAAKALIRPFVNQYLRYPPVTNEDRQAMRIPNRDPKPSPIPKPDDVPEVEVSTPHPRVLRIKFKRKNAKRWGKPKGVHGLECLWVISGKPPTQIKELLHSDFSTRSPLDLIFDEDERGKRVYFAVRWETGAMKKGPWSDIFSAIIP